MAIARTPTVRRGKRVTFTVSVQNDAEMADRLRVVGGTGSRHIRVVYLAPDGTDVTRGVVAGTLRTPTLVPGGTYQLRAVVTVRRTAPRGASLTRSVTAASTSVPAARDAVMFVVRRR